MTQENTPNVIAFADLSFDKAPSFCPNGVSFQNGKGIRFRNTTTLTTPGQTDVTIDKGSVLFRNPEGKVTLYTGEEFRSDFSRYLKDRRHVRLSRSDSTQLLAIREAEDENHLRDWAVEKGSELADASVATYQKLMTSELFLDLVLMAGDFGSGARELGKDLRERMDTAWNAPGNQPLRERVGTHVEGLKRGLKKLAWGKFDIDS